MAGVRTEHLLNFGVSHSSDSKPLIHQPRGLSTARVPPRSRDDKKTPCRRHVILRKIIPTASFSSHLPSRGPPPISPDRFPVLLVPFFLILASRGVNVAGEHLQRATRQRRGCARISAITKIRQAAHTVWQPAEETRSTKHPFVSRIITTHTVTLWDTGGETS